MKRFLVFFTVVTMLGACSRIGNAQVDGDEPEVGNGKEETVDKYDKLKKEYYEESIERGETAWIEVTDGVLLIQGTNDDDWIEVEEFVDEVVVEVRDLTSHAVKCDQTYRKQDVGILSIKILAKPGNDRITNHTWYETETLCGDGCDYFEGGFKKNVVFGGPGNDLIVVYGEQSEVYGGAGDDGIFHYWGECLLNGGAGNDYLLGGNGGNKLLGGEGDDILLAGGDASNEIYGGAGSDYIVGGNGNDVLYGDETSGSVSVVEGRDIVFGLDGIDTILGGGEDDELIGGPGSDDISGGRGDDHIYVRDGERDGTIIGNFGNDTICRDSADRTDDTFEQEDCSTPEPTIVNHHFDRSKFQMIFGIR